MIRTRETWSWWGLCLGASTWQGSGGRVKGDERVDSFGSDGAMGDGHGDMTLRALLAETSDGFALGAREDAGGEATHHGEAGTGERRAGLLGVRVADGYH